MQGKNPATPTREPTPLVDWIDRLSVFPEIVRESTVEEGEQEQGLLRSFLAEIDLLLPGVRSAIYLVDSETLDFDLTLVNDESYRAELEKAGSEQIRKGLFAWSLRSGRPGVADFSGDGEQTRGIILPLITVGNVVAISLLLRHDVQEEVSAEHLKMMSVLGTQVAFFVENARLFKRLSNQNHELERAIGRLPMELRVPLTMFYFEQRSAGTIARKLEISLSLTCQRIRAARAELHALLTEGDRHER